jgi:hypothetical protein
MYKANGPDAQYGLTGLSILTKRNRTKKQSSQALADRPARRGGLSARATRTVRLRTADCPHGYGGPSGLGRGLSDKANRTSNSDPE